MSQNNPPGAISSATFPPNHPNYGIANVTAPYNFDNEGGPVQLAWPNDLASATAFRRRVTRLPNLGSDPTIAIVKARHEQYIYQMVQAVFSTDTAKDNPDFDGVAWFTLGDEHAVSPYEVEAVCRVLFQAVIDRCESGYRGLDREERLSKKMPVKADFSCNCEARMSNVITALREWKSICKDVLVSDARVEQLANAPASIAKDKKKYRKNNGTKKETTQKDHAAGVTAVLGAEAADWLKAQGDLPPMARLGQQTKRTGRKKNNRGTNQSAVESLPQSQPQSQVSSASSQASDSGFIGEQLLAKLSEPQLRDFDLLTQNLFGSAHSTAGASGLPRDPPAYGSPDFSGLPQQGQPFVPRQGRPLAPQPSRRFEPQQHQAVPPVQPVYSPHHFGATQQTPQNLGGYGQGLVPVDYSTHINLHGPYSFNNWSNPYGNFTSPMGFHNYGLAPNNPSIPAAYGNDLGNNSLHAVSAATVLSQPARPLNAAAKQFKHARTATMDAQHQPEPTRIKRDQPQRNVTPGRSHVNE